MSMALVLGAIGIGFAYTARCVRSVFASGMLVGYATMAFTLMLLAIVLQ